MKKVCFFVGDISRSGGTERVTSIIANYLSTHSFEVSILSLQSGSFSFFPLENEIRIDSLFDSEGRGVDRFPETVMKLRKYIQNNKIDVLICVDTLLSLYSIPALFFLNVRNISWEHFNFRNNLGKKTRTISRYVSALFSDDIVTLTRQDMYLWRKNTILRANITQIYNPVSYELSEKTVGSGNVILAVGHLTYVKGFDLLISAWANICRIHTDWILRIVGSGEEELTLHRLCVDLNITQYVEFVPATRNIDYYYQNSSVLALTSRFEGFPMVLLEAQEYGLPIVAFDCMTGPSELIIDSSTGWLVEENNVELFSEKLSEVINMIQAEPLRHKDMVSNAKRNSKRFSKSAIGKQWIELLSAKKK
ncbi:glycosyltransferase family 4 protein [Citrobacter freundii]|nr:glycosyltransferase family 4 protein [Citrobacter freundii]